MLIRPLACQRIAWFLLAAMTLFTLVVLFYIIGFITSKGAHVITPEFLFGLPERMGKEGGILPTIIATIYLALLAILIATPIGVGSAVYLTEYTRESAITRIIRFGADALAGVPSIIFGLFGFIFFVIKLRMGWSVLAGGLTLAFMILPKSSAPAKRQSAPCRTTCVRSATRSAAPNHRPSCALSCPMPCPGFSPASSSGSAGA